MSATADWGVRRRLHTLTDSIAALRGWRRAGLAMAAGAASALAMAPWLAFPVLWLSFPVLVWLIDGTARAADAGRLGQVLPAATVGWCFGFGYFVAGLWWIGAAFLVEAEKFAWLMPFAVLAFPAFLALFWAFGAVLARLFWPDGWARILVFAAAFSLAEWLRGHALTGFPWNAVGYALAPAPVMMQSAAFVGLWGLTLAAFIVFAAPALLATQGGRRGDRLFLAFAATIFLVHLAVGVVRLADTPDREPANVRVRIVQPNVPQNEKWVEENADAIFDVQLELSAGVGTSDHGGLDLIIWPESAFPFYLDERPDALAALADLLPDGTTLLSGAARADAAGVFNAVLVIGDSGEILDAYDKAHLVPFGEYLPFQSALESIGISQLTGVPGGFAAGPGRRTLRAPGVPPFGPLVCYEIIFPGAATEPGNRPTWLLNVTNDAWYGDTPGPRQHFHQSRLRAVEVGLPLVRAANTGISAIVDANGLVLDHLDVDEKGVVDGMLPPALPPTAYGRYGDLAFWIMLIASWCTATIKHFNKNRYGNRQK